MVEGIIENASRGAPRGVLKIVATSSAGPSSYAAGGFTVSIPELKEVYSAFVEAGSGYLAEVASISGNTVTIKAYQFDYAATAAGAAVEVPDATDLSGVTFKILAIGGV